MSDIIHKSRNVSELRYHLVFPEKYRRVVVDKEVAQVIKGTCMGILKRYPIHFLEIGSDKDQGTFSYTVCTKL